MRIQRSDNLKKLPPYLFADLEDQVSEMKTRGENVYDLSIGDPDLPTPPQIIKVMQKAAMEQKYQGYSSSRGELFFREAVSDWYRKRFGVKLDPVKEICALLGSKEGIANLARAFVNVGDTTLVPDPGYPVYANGATILSGGAPASMPLLEENGFLPDLCKINPFGVKIMFLNYPNNPTGSVASKKFLREVVSFARDYSIIVCYDNAYSEIYFENNPPPSILEIPGAKDCCIEFNSCSKTYNMTGSRIGFAVGSEEIVGALANVKSQIDSGAPAYMQKACAYALSLYRGPNPPQIVKKNIETYRKRMTLLVEGLNNHGWECKPSPATFYLWTHIDGSSIEFAKKLLKRKVVVTPGIGFGQHGEGYIRFALTKDAKILPNVIGRIFEK